MPNGGPDGNLSGVLLFGLAFNSLFGWSWADPIAYEPPHRVVFSWDISPRWEIVTDPALASEVEVRFFSDTPGRTRVELEHRHIDRHGPEWHAVTGGVDGAEGWPLYLARYAALFNDGGED